MMAVNLIWGSITTLMLGFLLALITVCLSPGLVSAISDKRSRARCEWAQRKTMRRVLDARGMSLIEVMIASAILAFALVSITSAFPTAYVNVDTSGTRSKATAYAQQKLEGLKNQPFNPGPLTANDSLENGEFTRSWTVTQEPGTNVPNRLARITVTVTWVGRRPQTLTLETLRAEL